MLKCVSEEFHIPIANLHTKITKKTETGPLNISVSKESVRYTVGGEKPLAKYHSLPVYTYVYCISG